MSQVHRTMIQTAEWAPRSRELCAALAGPPGDGMFKRGCVPEDGPSTAAVTHYISSGMIETPFAAALKDPAVMYAACLDKGISITLAECTALLAAADISESPPFDALARVGLGMVEESA